MTVQAAQSGVVAAAPPGTPSLPAGARPTPPAPARAAVLLLVAALGLVGLIFWRSVYQLVQVWSLDENYSHGFLVPVISGYFAWRWCRAQTWPRRGDLGAGALLLVLGGLIHLGAVLLGTPLIDFLAVIAVLNGLARLFGGQHWARGLSFPILFLFFMFPLPPALTDQAALGLQGVVSSLATCFLQFFLPVAQQGNTLKMPGHTLEVGEACSGLRQIVAFIALAVIVAHLSRRSGAFKACVVLSAVPVAVVANLLRVLLMAFVLLQFGPQWIEHTPLGPAWLGLEWHTVWGLVTMAVGLGLFLAVVWWLGRLLPESTKVPAPASEANGPEQDPAREGPEPGTADRRLQKRLGVACACLAVAWAAQAALRAHLRAPDYPELPKPLAGFPVSLGAWHVRDLPSSTLPSPDQLAQRLQAADGKAPEEVFSRTYVLAGGPQAGQVCKLHMMYTRDGSDRTHHPLICYAVAGYVEDESLRATVAVPGKAAVVKRFCFQLGRGPEFVFYWHYTLEPKAGSATSFLQRLHQRFTIAQPSVTIKVFTSAQTDEQLAPVVEFVRQVDRQIQDHLPPGARMGSDTIPVRYIGPPRHGTSN
jgi:exosortase